MTDITPEQRTAWERLSGSKGNSLYNEDLSVVASLLPSELTNPQPELPEEQGVYLDKEGDEWRLNENGWTALWAADEQTRAEEDPDRYAPFTRLVPERPTITREQVIAAAYRAGKVGLGTGTADAIVALVNGKGAES